ncbi:hypothetical protein FRC02_009345 [Tulasnella sp. 418]|nr:hypothetical protein FRC02_009345 [Tulasnella sp. 418]
MSTAEEIQARLEYVEAILASQTALLAPYLENLGAKSRDLSDDSNSFELQKELQALYSFYWRESDKLTAPLGHQHLSLVGDRNGPHNDEAQFRSSSDARSVSASNETTTMWASAQNTITDATTSCGLEGPRVKRIRYASESPLLNSDKDYGLIALPDHDNLLQSQVKHRAGELVPPQLMRVLIEEYFARVHPLLPVLHPPTFFENFALYCDAFENLNHTGDISGTSHESKVLPILHALVAATIGFILDDPEGSGFSHLPVLVQGEDPKAELRTTAFELVVTEAIDNPSFEALQALVIVVLASIGQGLPPFAWELTGMMCRMTVQLGLNRESTSLPSITGREIGHPFQPFVLPANFLPPPRDPMEAEHRRRVFWTIFMIDRICATGTGWSVALNRRDFDVDLPCPDYLWDNCTVSAGCRPSEKSAFRWGPDASVSEESNSPRLRLWVQKGTPAHENAVKSTNYDSSSTADNTSSVLSHLQGSEASPVYSVSPRAETPEAITTLNRLNSNMSQTLDGKSEVKPLGPLATLVEAFEALSQVIAFVQQPASMQSLEKHISQLTELDVLLKAWRASWPEEIQELLYIDESGTSHRSPISALIHAVYISTIIVLHQNFAYPGKGQLAQVTEHDYSISQALPAGVSAPGMSIRDISTTSAEACSRATTEMEGLIRTMEADLPQMNPLMAFFVFVSGRNKLVRILRNTQASQMRGEMSSYLKALRSISTVWGLGHYFAEALELGCTFIEAHLISSPVEKSTLGLFDLRIPAFSSRIFVSIS